MCDRPVQFGVVRLGNGKRKLNVRVEPELVSETGAQPQSDPISG